MKEIENITPKISKIRPQRASQHYENWIVEMRNEAEKKHHQDTIFACQALLKLNTCLMFYDELLARDVLPILQDFFNQQNRSDELTDIAKKIYELYDAQDEELRTTSDGEKLEENPKLERLCQLLHDLYTSNIHSKGLLLARTRYTVEGLVALIRRQENLRRLVNPAKFVGQGRRDGTMTDTEQEITLLRFKEGYEETDGINLLVATDVAQEGLDMPLCNFVIRYNFVSNEIGSVQSKGRARAKNSECYLIVNKHSVNEMREYENLEKEHSMMDALEDIDKMGSDELCRGIRKKQVILYEHHRRKEEQKLVSRSQFLSEDITIHCKTCKQLLCKASSMRKRGSNYIVDDPDRTFESKTQEKKRSEPLSFRYDSHIGYISCGNKTCQGQLGPKIKYTQGTRLLGLALSKDSVMWQKAGETDFRQIKQWSKVPFPIAEESLIE